MEFLIALPCTCLWQLRSAYIGCGCNGAVYLVNMPEVSDNILTSSYCDIQGFELPGGVRCSDVLSLADCDVVSRPERPVPGVRGERGVGGKVGS